MEENSACAGRYNDSHNLSQHAFEFNRCFNVF